MVATTFPELVYGRSGAGKTSWLLKLAHYLYRTTGKRTRWNLADGGGETIRVTGWAGPDGFIDLVPFTIRDNVVETSQLICEGYRPADPFDPRSPLLAPTVQDLTETGLWIIEGLTYTADYLMGEKVGGMAYRMGRGEIFNRDEAFRFKDGSTQFGGNSRTHYGYVQRKMLDLIGRTTMLPGIKYWSAHETKVADDERTESIFGPDVVGQKLTTRIGASFGNTIHLHVVHTEQKTQDPVTKKEVKTVKREFRAYLQDHYDPDGLTPTKYYANARVDARIREQFPALVPEYLVPADPVRFYLLLDEVRRKEAELDNNTPLPALSLVEGLLSMPTTRKITV